MFEMIDEPSVPAKRCGGLCALGNLLVTIIIFVVGWVLIGALLKICALLFLLGWDLV